MNIERYRAEFPHIAEGYVHLNHAGVSGMSRRTTDRITEFLNMQSSDPLNCFGWAMEQSRQCRERLARLMGVPDEHLAFTKNTAHALSIVADALDWKPGDEVVFADCEYPANSYPWLAQQDRDVVAKIVATPPDGRLRLADFADAITDRTRVLAISWVQFTTGYRTDLAALTRLAHERGVIVVADIIQGLGAFPIDIAGLGVDVAAVGSQKWLIGPLGVGGLYVHPDTLAHMRLVNMGAGAVKNVGAFDTLNFDVKPTVQRYEEGTPNIMGYCGLNSALEVLEEFGQPAIADRILALTRRTMDGLSRLGYAVTSPIEDHERAGLVMFQHPTLACDEIAAGLTAKKINVVTRGGKVRITPHFYNTEEDIDKALEALPEV